ncbi:MAG TPA: phosphatidylglycerophosphatase A [Opitutaceae bacterium]|nr:phosphatidylglycerophosphatase A [Opitutaceae bacterium]
MRWPQPLWPRRLSSRVVINCATLGPLGQKLPAPGTWGALAGLLYFALFFYRAGIFDILLGTLVAGYIAVALCGEAEVRLGKTDPGEVILDEFVVMPLCFLGWHWIARVWPPAAVLLAGFALFRFYDILKPLGIARLQALPGGWGVVIDDVAAALAACGTLHLAAWLWTRR